MSVVEKLAQCCYVDAGKLEPVSESLDQGAHVCSFHQDGMHVDAL